MANYWLVDLSEEIGLVLANMEGEEQREDLHPDAGEGC